MSEIVKRIQELREQVSTEGEKLLREHFSVVFDKYPQVIGLTWVGYTPFWNDGEQCQYSSCHEYSDIVFMVDGKELSWNESSEEDCKTAGVTEKIQEEFQKHFPDLDDDDMLAIFGDHAKITLYRDRVEVEEYEHE